MAYVFKKVNCLKGEVYDKIIELMTTAGWKDISSKPTDDFKVMHSKGESDNSNIYVQLCHHTGVEASSSVITTVKTQIRFRLLKSYTPGASGVAGICNRPGEAYAIFNLVSNAGAPPDIAPSISGFEITYYCDKNVCCFFVRPPEPTYSTNGPAMLYFGVSIDGLTDMDPNRELHYMMTNPAVTNIMYIDNPTNYADLGAITPFTRYAFAAPKATDWMGRLSSTPQLFGNSAIGIRKEEQLFMLLVDSSPVFDRDIIVDDATGVRSEIGKFIIGSHPLSTNTITYQLASN